MSNGRELIGARATRIAAPPAAVRGSWFGREAVQGFIWIAPAFLYLAFFIAYPFFMSIYLSVSSARVGSPDGGVGRPARSAAAKRRVGAPAPGRRDAGAPGGRAPRRARMMIPGAVRGRRNRKVAPFSSPGAGRGRRRRNRRLR